MCLCLVGCPCLGWVVFWVCLVYVLLNFTFGIRAFGFVLFCIWCLVWILFVLRCLQVDYGGFNSNVSFISYLFGGIIRDLRLWFIDLFFKFVSFGLLTYVLQFVLFVLRVFVFADWVLDFLARVDGLL